MRLRIRPRPSRQSCYGFSRKAKLNESAVPKPIKIDVRVISATNKDLVDWSRQRRSAKDLYYRLAVLPVHLPRCGNDGRIFPLLVAKFIADSCHRHRQEFVR